MLEKKRRKPYWRETKMQSMRSLVLPALLFLSSPFWIERVGAGHYIGLPVSFLLLALGSVVLVVVAAARFVLRQDEIDHWHGAHEDL